MNPISKVWLIPSTALSYVRKIQNNVNAPRYNYHLFFTRNHISIVTSKCSLSITKICVSLYRLNKLQTKFNNKACVTYTDQAQSLSLNRKTAHSRTHWNLLSKVESFTRLLDRLHARAHTFMNRDSYTYAHLRCTDSFPTWVYYIRSRRRRRGRWGCQHTRGLLICSEHTGCQLIRARLLLARAASPLSLYFYISLATRRPGSAFSFRRIRARASLLAVHRPLRSAIFSLSLSARGRFMMAAGYSTLSEVVMTVSVVSVGVGWGCI